MSAKLKGPKIILVGEEAANALATLSESDVDTVHYATSDDADPSDSASVLALYHGVLKAAGGTAIHCYARPEGIHPEAMLGLLRDAGIGLLVLLDGQDPFPLRDLDRHLHSLQAAGAQLALGVGLSNAGVTANYSIDDYQAELLGKEIHAPVFEVDCREYDDLVMLVEALLSTAAVSKRAVA